MTSYSGLSSKKYVIPCHFWSSLHDKVFFYRNVNSSSSSEHLIRDEDWNTPYLYAEFTASFKLALWSLKDCDGLWINTGKQTAFIIRIHVFLLQQAETTYNFKWENKKGCLNCKAENKQLKNTKRMNSKQWSSEYSWNEYYPRAWIAAKTFYSVFLKMHGVGES